jgi:hypothetical protein
MSLAWNFQLDMPRKRRGITLTVTNNGDGTATATWTDSVVRTEGYYATVYLDGPGDIVAYNAAKTYLATINNPAPKAFSIEYYDGDDNLIATSNTVTKTITGDTVGAAYGAILQGTDGVSLSSNYAPEMALISGLRTDGIFSKLKAALLFGYGNTASCRRELISLAQGTIPGGTVTANAGYVAFSSNGRIRFPAALNTLLLSVNSQGYAFDLRGSMPGSGNAYGVVGTGASSVSRVDLEPGATFTSVRVGNNGASEWTPNTSAFDADDLWMVSRTSAANSNLYRWTGAAFSTVGTTTGLSGGVIPDQPMSVAAINAEGTDVQFWTGSCRSMWIFDGMSSAEWALFCARYQTFKVAKGWTT